MLFLLFIPASVQIAHAFEVHEHVICHSEIEQHFHADEVDCVLCHLQAETHGILPSSDYNQQLNLKQIEYNNFYHSYLNHQHLSYSLRAPPIL